MSLDSLELLQLADGCFPSGGFAFSNGLESLAKLGHLQGMQDFREYMECHLDQITSAELPFLNSAYAEAAGDLGDGFESIVREWDAWIFLPAPRRASIAQGQAWARTMETTYDSPSIHGIRPWFSQRQLPLHFIVVIAATLHAGAVSLAAAQTLVMHMAIRDQLGAAVRLGLLGSLQAQKLHRDFIHIGEKFRQLRSNTVYMDAVRSAPMIDLGQASHPHLYSKLFQR